MTKEYNEMIMTKFIEGIILHKAITFLPPCIARQLNDLFLQIMINEAPWFQPKKLTRNQLTHVIALLNREDLLQNYSELEGILQNLFCIESTL